MLKLFFILVTFILSPYVLLPVSAGIIYYLYKKKQEWKLWLFSSGIGIILATLLKEIFHTVRPDGTPGSFPSRHTSTATVFFLLLIYSFKNSIKNKVLRGCFVFLSFLCIVLVAISRIYLHKHWLIDVIAGFLLGVFVYVFWLKVVSPSNH